MNIANAIHEMDLPGNMFKDASDWVERLLVAYDATEYAKAVYS